MRFFKRKQTPFEESRRTIQAMGRRLQQSRDLAEIIEHIKGDKLTLDVMEHHEVTFRDFEHWFQQLVLSGAGQTIRDTYVPSTAFLIPPAMDFVATTLKRSEWDEHNKWIFISAKLVEFADGGEGVSGSMFGKLGS